MAGTAMLILALVAIAAVLLIPRDTDDAGDDDHETVDIPVQRRGEQDVPRTAAEQADQSGAKEWA